MKANSTCTKGEQKPGHSFKLCPRYTVDLLRKSRVESEFNVVNAGDEVEAEAETFTTATVAFSEDTKHFEPADDALDMEAKAGKGAVGSFFLVRQRVMLSDFDRQAGLSVQLV